MTECSICLECINEEHKHETECKHIFHQACIGRWLDNHNTCPNCRKEIQEQKEPEQPEQPELIQIHGRIFNLQRLLLIVREQRQQNEQRIQRQIEIQRQRRERQRQRQMETQRRRIEQRDERLMINGGLALQNGKVRCTHCNSDCNSSYWNKHIITKKHLKNIRLRGG